MIQSIMKIDKNGTKIWYLNGVEFPWLEESLKTKAHLDEILSQNESTISKRKI